MEIRVKKEVRRKGGKTDRMAAKDNNVGSIMLGRLI